MKRIISLIVLLALFCTGCANYEQVQNDKLNIVCTVFPQYDFVREIAKDRVNLTMLLPLGSEAHSYEPTANNIIALNRADLFIGIGGESEHWAEHLLDGVKNENLETLYLLKSVELYDEEYTEGMEKSSHNHTHSEHTHLAAADEHIWTSPQNAIAMCTIIYDTLCRLDKANAHFFKKNYAEYKQKLEKLDVAFKDAVKGSARNTLVFGDRFPMRYLTEELGLEYFAVFPGCSSKTEPSAKTVAFLSDKVSSEKIPVVFYMDYSDGRHAKAIAKHSNAKAKRLYSCHNLSKKDFENGENYISLMTKNAHLLREALL